MSRDAFLAQYRAHLELILAPARAASTQLAAGTPSPETLRAVRLAHDRASEELAEFESVYDEVSGALTDIEWDLDELEDDEP